jgi:hypothetical protein
MADTKLTGLGAGTTLLSTDILYYVSDPGGTPVSKKVTYANLVGGITSSTPTSGWVTAVGTWTYATASTITVPTDATTTYHKGMKIRFKQGGGYKYYVAKIVASTLITVFVNTDFTVANAAITDVAYSFSENPYGFPDWFTYAPTTGGITVGNGTGVYKYKVMGYTINAILQFTLGNTSAITGGVTFTAPVTEGNYTIPTCWLQDSGTNTFAGLAAITTGTITVYAINAAGTYMSVTALSSTVPFTWATGDWITINILYNW